MAWSEDERKKWWSESNVSEDLEMSLRLQIAGWQVRYATYYAAGFQEGASLTVYDELRRWQKYGYGCVRPILTRLTSGPNHVSSPEKMVATGALYPAFYYIPQIGYQKSCKVHPRSIRCNISYFVYLVVTNLKMPSQVRGFLFLSTISSKGGLSTLLPEVI